MPQFIDKHLAAPGLTAEELTIVHGGDPVLLDAEGVTFLQAWSDPGSGALYCLSEAPDADAVRRVHEPAGHPPDEINPLTFEAPEVLAVASTPDGSTIELRRIGNDYVIRAEGYDLMTSRAHGTEDSMLALACPDPLPGACVLIGGLGMGYTLAATLAALDATSRVVVAELVPEIVEWNKGPLGSLAGRPLDDPRVEVVVGDVAALIGSSVNRFDAILLDVDNGPDTLTDEANAALYAHDGLRAAFHALRPDGALAVWSVGDDPNVALPVYEGFEARLRTSGFAASSHAVAAGNRGRTHVVIVGRRT
ncbi:MAG: DUF4242 domain-containing protein [Dehalococcoidia bacterium]|nr:DUF4242 domain-containing protein [Dehalococcoidia bacterium]